MAKRQKVSGDESSRQAERREARASARRSQSSEPEVVPEVPTDPNAPAAAEDNVPERLNAFRSRDHSHRFRFDMVGRKMTTLYYLDLNSFNNTPGLEFVNWLRNAGLEPFLSFREVGYLDVVREFYGNLDIAYEDGVPTSLSSRVDGFNVNLSVAEFRGMFQIPADGAGVCYRHGDVNFSDIFAGEGDALLGVYHDITIGRTRPRVGKEKFPSGELQFHEYVAHRSLCKVLFPLLSSTDSLSFYQAYYIYALKHGRRVDFAAAIFAHMDYVVSHTTCGLPYGHFITRILRETHAGFPDTPITPSGGITISSLGQMNIHFNSQFSCWTWRGVQVTNLANPIRDIPTPVVPSAPVDVPESSSSTSHGSCVPWLKKIAAMMRSNRRQSRKEYERLKARQDEWYRMQKEKDPDTYSALYEDAGSPVDPTIAWAHEADDTLGEEIREAAGDAEEDDDDDSAET